MKFTFAAACLLGVTLADQKFTLVDKFGVENDNVTTADIRYDINVFKSDWYVEGGQGIYGVTEGGEGQEIRNTYFNYGVELSISKNDLYDETIFEGSSGVVFNIGVAGEWPDQRDSYAVYLQVTCADGTVIEQNENKWVIEYNNYGYVSVVHRNIRLEADTTSCDITNVIVTFFGIDDQDSNGPRTTIWKDMDYVDLYVWHDSAVEDMFSGFNGPSDHVWTNDDGYKVKPEHCFDIVSVNSEETVEFVAYSSTPANIVRADQLVPDIELYRVMKNGQWLEQVANSDLVKADGGAKLTNQSALVYDQKVKKDTLYQICFFWDEADVEENENVIEAKAGWYQYGYHIYD